MTIPAWVLRVGCLVALSAAACGGVSLGGGDGGAGTTGTAGTTATGGAGTTGGAGHGAAGTSGGAGTTGGAGTSGQGGTGGTVGCGVPACDIYCAYGYLTDASGCALCQCKPPPACSATECGAASAAAPYCPGGRIVPGTCERNVDGKCAWTPAQCITSCPLLTCPEIACAYGYVKGTNGCPTCQCNPCPTGTHAVGCPKILCTLACPDGLARDANGCAACSCRKPATCAGSNALCAFCTYGYRTGPNGCRSCDCEDPPAGCGFDAAGGAP